MRKSLILKLIIVLVILAISAMSYKIYTKQLDKNRYTTISMPAFQFTNNNGSLSNQTNVKHNVPVLFIYVSPYCETCTSLLTEIRKIDNKNNLDLG